MRQLRKNALIYRTVILSCILPTLSITTQGFPMFYGSDVREKHVASKEPLEPTEVQNAMCNIVTDQIKATANATITRQLKGVCHSKEVRDQLRHIEIMLMRELHKIQRSVQTVISHQTRNKPVIFKYLSNRPN